MQPRRVATYDPEQYNLIMKMDDPRFTWMNWGIDDSDLSWVKPEDLEWKYQINLAAFTVRDVLLDGKAVLDTGCGRGGTCSYLTRYHRPSRVVGLDFNRGQVEWCSRHAMPSIEFVHGDAQAMNFASAEFDVVTNIESACHYPDLPAFFGEVRRVLKVGGVFAHSCNYYDVPTVERQMAAARLKIERAEDITDRVTSALEKNEENFLRLIREICSTREQRLIGHQLHAFLGFTAPAMLIGPHRYMSWLLRAS
jgi:O-methyltransferase